MLVLSFAWGARLFAWGATLFLHFLLRCCRLSGAQVHLRGAQCSLRGGRKGMLDTDLEASELCRQQEKLRGVQHAG
ncbi:hypothetical protein A2U01_0057760 [Trifolium medium]|uniref:Uncharacterized protein n=1 Tax=Trifolium medium TaxID=97028 RepID=A0A392RJX4_9FABA|nr:hypothetical protein [Trifolium medium]